MIVMCSKVYDIDQKPIGWVVSNSGERVSSLFPSLILAQKWAEKNYAIKGWSKPSLHSRCKQVYGRF
jgi:hypothetical protein